MKHTLEYIEKFLSITTVMYQFVILKLILIMSLLSFGFLEMRLVMQTFTTLQDVILLRAHQTDYVLEWLSKVFMDLHTMHLVFAKQSIKNWKFCKKASSAENWKTQINEINRDLHP